MGASWGTGICSQVEPSWRGDPSEHKWIWTQMPLVMREPHQHMAVMVLCPQHSPSADRAPSEDVTRMISFKPCNSPEGGACLPPRDNGSQSGLHSCWDEKSKSDHGGRVSGSERRGQRAGQHLQGTGRNGRERVGFGGSELRVGPSGTTGGWVGAEAVSAGAWKAVCRVLQGSLRREARLWHRRGPGGPAAGCAPTVAQLLYLKAFANLLQTILLTRDQQ